MPSLLCCQYIWAVSLYLFSQFLVSTIYSLLWTAVKSVHFIFLSTCPFFIHFLIITIISRGKIYLLPTTLKTMSPFGAKFGQVFLQLVRKYSGSLSLGLFECNATHFPWSYFLALLHHPMGTRGLGKWFGKMMMPWLWWSLSVIHHPLCLTQEPHGFCQHPWNCDKLIYRWDTLHNFGHSLLPGDGRCQTV